MQTMTIRDIVVGSAAMLVSLLMVGSGKTDETQTISAPDLRVETTDYFSHPWCDPFDCFDDTSYLYQIWTIPGDGEAFSCRFETGPHVYTPLRSAALAVAPQHCTGDPTLRISVWADDGWGAPETLLQIYDIPFDSFPPSPNFVGFSLGEPQHTFEPWEDFHIGCTMVGDAGDTLALLNDCGTGPHSGELRCWYYEDSVWSPVIDFDAADPILLSYGRRCNGWHEAEVVDVPAQFPDLRTALDSCQPGDTVKLADGLYFGDGFRDIDLLGAPIVITSENGAPVTVIDIQGSTGDHHRAFRIHGTDDSDPEISGLTFRNGWGSIQGGVIESNAGRPRIHDCVFEDNYAITDGGAIVCGNIEISNSVFRDNESGHGGAISLSHGYSTDTTSRIESCLFVGNGGMSGGAIACLLGHEPLIANCTFFGNSAGEGNDLWVYQAQPLIRNCIMAFGQIGAAVYSYDYGTPVYPSLECTDIFGHAGGDWTDGIADQLGDNGNVWFDPLFCDTAAGDYGIDSLSLCNPSNFMNPCEALIGYRLPSCRTHADADLDLVADVYDNCPIVYNPDQIDLDQDGLGDPCDPVCCLSRGDIDYNGTSADIADLVYLVSYMFQNGPEPPCLEEADINGDLAGPDIADLVYLVSYMFQSGPAPVPCP